MQNHDVVHFAGHSYYDAESPTKSGWRLAEDVLTAGEISKLGSHPLLVFSNSCQAGTTAEWDGPRSEGQAFGIGSAFLLARVKNYIGTFWVVDDDESARFAARYYRNMAQGHSWGTALQAARRAALGEQDGHSLTWASYMLYGDPGFPLLSHAANVLGETESAAVPVGISSPSSPSSATRSATSLRSHTADVEEEEQQVSRKLAAVLLADVQGYSRLMGEDEEATIRTLTAFRAVLANLIQ